MENQPPENAGENCYKDRDEAVINGVILRKTVDCISGVCFHNLELCGDCLDKLAIAKKISVNCMMTDRDIGRQFEIC